MPRVLPQSKYHPQSIPGVPTCPSQHYPSGVVWKARTHPAECPEVLGGPTEPSPGVRSYIKHMATFAQSYPVRAKNGCEAKQRESLPQLGHAIYPNGPARAGTCRKRWHINSWQCWHSVQPPASTSFQQLRPARVSKRRNTRPVKCYYGYRQRENESHVSFAEDLSCLDFLVSDFLLGLACASFFQLFVLSLAFSMFCSSFA